MKFNKIILMTALTLSISMMTFGASYADNETALPTGQENQASTLASEDFDKLLAMNEEQTKIEEQKNQEQQKASEEVSSSAADKIISAAKSKLGTPYVFGATGPSAFDCSGFTSYAYRQAGISLPRVASDQAYAGKKVSKSDLQKGDLVFFNTYGGISHVGIYIGSGNFIHASSYGRGVVIANLNDSYYVSRYVTAARYL